MSNNVIVAPYCVHIEDSYLVSKRDMQDFLEGIRSSHGGETIVFDARTMKSLVCEWIVHNFLYSLHLYRSRTKDVDLDYPSDKPEWVYIAIGTIVKPFVR